LSTSWVMLSGVRSSWTAPLLDPPPMVKPRASCKITRRPFASRANSLTQKLCDRPSSSKSGVLRPQIAPSPTTRAIEEASSTSPSSPTSERPGCSSLGSTGYGDQPSLEVPSLTSWIYQTAGASAASAWAALQTFLEADPAGPLAHGLANLDVLGVVGLGVPSARPARTPACAAPKAGAPLRCVGHRVIHPVGRHPAAAEVPDGPVAPFVQLGTSTTRNGGCCRTAPGRAGLEAFGCMDRESDTRRERVPPARDPPRVVTRRTPPRCRRARDRHRARR
jgi:hypothetical protein